MKVDRIFLSTASPLWGAGYSAIPCRKKAPAINSHPSYQDNLPSKETQADWLTKFPNCNIGVVMGTKIGDGTILAALDIDNDPYCSFIRAVVGNCLVKKKGQRGETIFVRLPEGQKTTTFKRHDKEPVVDILAGGKLCIIPPSIHPKTNEPYVWTGEKELAECAPQDLPFVDVDKLSFIKLILSRSEHLELLEGRQTHKAALTLTSCGAAFLVDEETACRSLMALLPNNYEGNIGDELSGLYRTAKEKGLGAPGSIFQEYDPGTRGPIPLGVTKDSKYVLIDQNLNTIKFRSARQLANPDDLMDMAPAAFWAAFEPAPKTSIGFAPKKIADHLMELCRKRKVDRSHIRGMGVWREDDGSIVQNVMGPVPQSKKYIYIRFEEIEDHDAQTY